MDWIIAGLGNPGKVYETHRHNVGFQAIEALRQAFAFPPFQCKNHALISQEKIEGRSVLMCCPLRYMNLSGQVIVPLVKFYQGAHLVVIHDDLDLPCGILRFKHGGGTGGHNGLKDIHRLIGSDYDRLRIGIGRPEHREQVSAYVLSPFSSAQKPLIGAAFDHLISVFSLLIEKKLDLFVQELHSYKP